MNKIASIILLFLVSTISFSNANAADCVFRSDQQGGPVMKVQFHLMLEYNIKSKYCDEIRVLGSTNSSLRGSAYSVLAKRSVFPKACMNKGDGLLIHYASDKIGTELLFSGSQKFKNNFAKRGGFSKGRPLIFMTQSEMGIKACKK